MPDDLIAATMRSTADLSPGDKVAGGRLPLRHRPLGVGRRGVGPEARLPLARGQAGTEQPDPVRRRRQPRQFGRAAGHHGRRGGRHRHRHPQPHAGSAPSSASASRCRSRTPPRPPACRPSDARRFIATNESAHRMSTRPPASDSATAAADGADPLRGQARRRRAGPLPRARDGRHAGAGPPAGRGRAGPGQDAHRQDAGQHRARPVQAHPVHARPGAGRPGRHAHLQPEDRRLQHLARPGVHQPAAGRRNQPRAGQGAERAARGDAGAPGHHRRRNAQGAAAPSW